MYFQNTGLTSYTIDYFGNHNSFTYINLVSYNGTSVPTGIRQSTGRLLRQPDIASRYVSKTIQIWQRFAIPATAFTLTGKRIPAARRMAPGMIIMDVRRSLKTP
jgi:hypothetical protein